MTHPTRLPSFFRSRTRRALPRTLRRLLVASFARGMAHGLMLTIGVLYLTLSVRLPVGAISTGLTVAAVLGMLASMPSGRLADRLGPHRVIVLILATESLGVAGYLVVGQVATFLAVAIVVAVCESGAEATRGSLIAGIAEPGQKVRTRALVRSVNNIAIALGAVGGGVVLRAGTRRAFLIALALGALGYALAAILHARLPAGRLVAAPTAGARRSALRDRAFVQAAALSALLALNQSMLSFGVPLWIAQRTEAPTWTYSGVLVINTAGVVLLQVRASRNLATASQGARALRRAGAFLAGCCLLFALSEDLGPSVTAALLFLGAILLTAGEMLVSAGGWAVLYDLAPDRALGEYVGLFGAAAQAVNALAPVTIAALVLGMGRAGWLVIGTLMLLAGLLAPAASSFALRMRPEQQDA
jgi:MFS family permease